MPADIRALVEELRAIARAPGAQTRDGREWRTISKGTVDLLIGALVRSWRPEETVADEPGSGRENSGPGLSGGSPERARWRP